MRIVPNKYNENPVLNAVRSIKLLNKFAVMGYYNANSGNELLHHEIKKSSIHRGLPRRIQYFKLTGCDNPECCLTFKDDFYSTFVLA